MGKVAAKLRGSKNLIDRRTGRDFEESDDVLVLFNLATQKFDARFSRIKNQSKRKGSYTSSLGREHSLRASKFRKWLHSLTHKITPPEIPEELSYRTLYLFKHDWQIRIFSINVCRSRFYPIVFDCFILAFYTRMTIFHFLNRYDPQYDIFGTLVGLSLFLDLIIHLIAFGLIGHRSSFLFRSSFNFVKIILALCFFLPSAYFLQVLQCFRIFSVINKFDFMQSFAAKTKIIRKSLLSLSMFAALYLLMIFLFSLFSWLVLYDSMSKYCLPTADSDVIHSVTERDLVADLQRPLHNQQRLSVRLPLRRLKSKLGLNRIVL